MSIEAIDHLYVETASFDAALEFWTALGFRVADQWGEGGHRACRLESGAAAVVLAQPDDGAQPCPVTVHFRVPDVDRMAADVADPGGDRVSVEVPPEDTHWGTRWMRVRDPDGRVFSIEQTAAARGHWAGDCAAARRRRRSDRRRSRPHACSVCTNRVPASLARVDRDDSRMADGPRQCDRTSVSCNIALNRPSYSTARISAVRQLLT